MSVSTHVLDLVTGRPAAGLEVTLEALGAEGFHRIAGGRTDADGRIKDLVARGAGATGTFRIRFETAAWLGATPTFYPYVEIVFVVVDADAHHHVPLLLGPYGYSTYRGS